MYKALMVAARLHCIAMHEGKRLLKTSFLSNTRDEPIYICRFILNEYPAACCGVRLFDFHI
jgi:hypothetical protein